MFYSIVILVAFVNTALPQGLGSGSNGNLRLCVVESRGTYKRATKFCPVLDKENAGIECVIGYDRLDCLRRMTKGTVDFGVFSPEDLIAAQWANIDGLVTNELRNRPRPFERSIVAVVNKRILPDTSSTIHAVLRNSTLCHPGHGEDSRQPMSDTLAEYLESLVAVKSCDPKLSVVENRLKSMVEFFSSACVAGPWLSDIERNAELKNRYTSLCSACGSPRCAASDRYWGSAGALLCLVESAGDFTWAENDKVINYFGLTPGTSRVADPDSFVYLCRDGTWQPLVNNTNPCVWINRPWPVVVSKSKTAAAVSNLTYSLTNSSITVLNNWYGALAALLEINQEQPAPLQPPQAPLDYLANAKGFREAYSQAGCQPPRHITVCTTSILERYKCDWLSEAGKVYGVAPELKCVLRGSSGRPAEGGDGGTDACLACVHKGDCDVAIAESDWLVRGLRDYSLMPILHEATPIVEKASTVVAYVKDNGGITKMADLRGKKAAFPLYDGLAWHSAVNYFHKKEKMSCKHIVTEYFSKICAPGFNVSSVSNDVADKFVENCSLATASAMEGELTALRSLVEGQSDVAFISMSTYNMYKDKKIHEIWATGNVKISPLCPEENPKYCFISWSNIGHIYAARNISSLRKHEIVNVFTQMDTLFGKNYPFHSAMFSMYGPFNHKLDILFHSNTKTLATDDVLRMHPYYKIPLHFETSILNAIIEDCRVDSSFGAKLLPSIATMLVSLFFLFSS